jgi:hypothetical protein
LQPPSRGHCRWRRTRASTADCPAWTTEWWRSWDRAGSPRHVHCPDWLCCGGSRRCWSRNPTTPDCPGRDSAKTKSYQNLIQMHFVFRAECVCICSSGLNCRLFCFIWGCANTQKGHKEKEPRGRESLFFSPCLLLFTREHVLMPNFSASARIKNYYCSLFARGRDDDCSRSRVLKERMGHVVVKINGAPPAITC